MENKKIMVKKKKNANKKGK
jgi:hypothetical protein